MSVFVKISAVCLVLSATSALAAGIADITADGTWDCKDDAGASLGAVVIADSSYAFIKPDGKAGAYGQLKRVALADVELPTFVVLSGHVKDEMGAIGMAMRGPKGNIEKTSGELFLNIIITENDLIECVRRMAPAT